MQILKSMSEMTERMDLKDFACKLGLSSEELTQHMTQMARSGLLKKSGGSILITEKGKLATKAITPVPTNMRFNFYTDIDQPTGASAETVKEFRDLALKVNACSLEFHLYRGDFENWFTAAIEDPAFAAELSKLKKRELKCEDLREALTKALETWYRV